MYENPTIDGRNAALIGRQGVYADGQWHDFDQARVTEDVTHSFYEGTGSLHPPFEGETNPIDPRTVRSRASTAGPSRPPATTFRAGGYIPLEAGPLARRMAAGGPGAAAHQDNDGLFVDMVGKIGASVFVRQLARMHEAPKYYKWARQWLDQIDLKESFYTKPVEHADGKGFGSTEAARGSLSDWIVIEDNKIKNYQVVTPDGMEHRPPRDGAEVLGPIEQALVGSPIIDPRTLSSWGGTSHAASTPAWCARCTPTTASRAGNSPSS